MRAMVRSLALAGVIFVLGCGGDGGAAADGAAGDGGGGDGLALDAPTFDAAPPDARAVPVTTTIKVMSVNLRHDSDQWERRFELIADEIVRLEPDLIGLQEIEIGDGSVVSQTEELIERIDARLGAASPRYQSYEHLKIGLAGIGGEGVGLLSRYPIEETGFDDLYVGGRLQVFARVRVAEDVTVDLYNTHLHNDGPVELRTTQAGYVLDAMAARGGGKPLLFTGDMNAVPTSELIGILVAGGLVDSFPAVHGAEAETIGLTSPVVLAEGAFEQTPTRRIDYVFARDPVRGEVVPLEAVVTLKNHDEAGFYPSDHFGVMTTYEVTVR